MDLYAQNILDRYKEPYYRNKDIKADLENEEANHTCGDKITVKLAIGHQNSKQHEHLQTTQTSTNDPNFGSLIINNYSFSGEGCAISQAAADILGDLIVGKTLEEALNMTKEELFEALGIEISPRRSKCALLAFETMKGAISRFKIQDLRFEIQDSSVISDVIKMKPKVAEIFAEYGLGCAHCELGKMETIAEGAKAHGLSDEEISELINRLKS